MTLLNHGMEKSNGFSYYTTALQNVILRKHNNEQANNMELNDLRKIICLRNTSVSVERISVFVSIVCHAQPNFQ